MATYDPEIVELKRQQITAIDRALGSLVGARNLLACELGKLKRDGGHDVVVASRENDVIHGYQLADTVGLDIRGRTDLAHFVIQEATRVQRTYPTVADLLGASAPQHLAGQLVQTQANGLVTVGAIA